jgi:allantoicase
VEGIAVDGYPTVDELLAATWSEIVPRSRLAGDAENRFDVRTERRWTHVRLTIYPDGGVARLRVLGDVVPDPRFLAGTVDLAALENGGSVVDCSDEFYGSPTNLLLPGRARHMGEGWENARRRGPGNDYVMVRLGAPGRLREVEIDTSYFVGNAPGMAALTGVDSRAAALGDAQGWVTVLEQTRLQPDTRHRFRVDTSPVTHVRLDVYPDGGVARLRLIGEVEPEELAALIEAPTQERRRRGD